MHFEAAGIIHRLPLQPASNEIGGRIPGREYFNDMPGGRRFGRLVALHSIHARRKTSPGGNRQTISNWLMQCDCGVEVVVPLPHLLHGRNNGFGCTQSCGCLRSIAKKAFWVRYREEKAERLRAMAVSG
jgi:hypothetical protein